MFSIHTALQHSPAWAALPDVTRSDVTRSLQQREPRAWMWAACRGILPSNCSPSRYRRSFTNKTGANPFALSQGSSPRRPARGKRASANRVLERLQGRKGVFGCTDQHQGGKWSVSVGGVSTTSVLFWPQTPQQLISEVTHSSGREKSAAVVFGLEGGEKKTPLTAPWFNCTADFFPPRFTCRHINILHRSQYKNIFKATLKKPSSSPTMLLRLA